MLRRWRAPANVAVIRKYLELSDGSRSPFAREALRWFFTLGRRMARGDSRFENLKAQKEFSRPRDLKFQRGAGGRRRVPTVLSRGECQRLFEAMEGPGRLMAELVYGAGLRLMELLRLRMHYLDLDRQRVVVAAGKGDRDRVTVLPESLVAPLRRQLERLRVLFQEDRAAVLPGVWLPENVARKYPKAGGWEWQWVFPSREASADPVSGARRRHHLTDTSFQRILKSGARARTVQGLLGHQSVETTQIYTHVMERSGLGVRSPMDFLKR